MTVFFISDTHFCHAPILDQAARPFTSIEEMEAAIIANWNAVVRSSDDVFHLGDFAFRGGPERHQKIFDRLAGRKHLIRGNHDHKHVPTGWSSIADIRVIDLDGDKIVLSHYPMREWPGFYSGAYHLHGHTHSRLPGSARTYDVGVDQVGFTPLTWPQVKALMAPLPDLQFVQGQPFNPEPEFAEEEDAGPRP